MLQRFQSRRQVSRKLNRQILRGSPYVCEALEKRVLLAAILPQASLVHSLPGASQSIFLDFDGNPAFTFYNGTTYTAHGAGATNTPIPAFTMDADANNFSPLELTTIQNIWAIVAEKYSPFNIDVTTQDPGNRTHGVTEQVIIGGSNSDWYDGSAGGLSAIGGFANAGLSNNCFAWTGDLNWTANSDPLTTGSTFSTNYTGGYDISHEAGHSFGLVHQRKGNLIPFGAPIEYYNGDATRSPIMGNAHNGPNKSKRGIWWLTNMDGLQNSPDPIQDDLAVLSNATNGFGYRADDHSYSNYVTLSPAPDGTIGPGTGIIENTADVDPFAFRAIGPNGTFTIKPTLTVTNGGMLSPSASLLDASTLSPIPFSFATSGTTITLTTTAMVPGHDYFIKVSSVGNYGDIGQYTVSGLLPSFAFMSGNTLIVNGYGDNANKITIKLNAGTYTVTDDIFGSTAIQTFNATPVDTIRVQLGSGADTLNYGGGDLSSMAVASISMGGGSDTLSVDDSAYTPVTTYEVYSGQINRTLSLLGTAQYDSSVENLKFYPGPGSNNVVNVYSTSAATSIQSGNTSIINIGQNGSVQGINGALSISNPPAHSSLNIDDSADATGRSCLLSRTGVSSLSPAPISWNPNDINGVTVSGGPGGNSFGVLGVPPLFGGAQNTINAGANNDSVYMAFVAQGTLIVNGQGGSDTLTVDDTFSTGLTYAIGDGSITRTGLSLTYNTVETVNLNAGDSADTFNINALPQFTAVNVNAGGNYDLINVAPTFKRLPSFNGGLSIDGGANGAGLTFDNSAASNFFISTITGTTFSAGQGTANYSNIYTFTYNLALLASRFVNLVTISGTTNLTSYVINGSNGNDTLNLGSGSVSGIVSGITFNPGGGTDALNINDQNDSVAQAYTFNAGSLAAAGLFTVSYSAILESMTLNAGSGDDTVTVAGTTGGTQTFVNGFAGNDTINIGSTGLGLVAGAVTADGGSGYDYITVNDPATSVGMGYTITPTTVATGFFFGGLTYTNAEGLTLNTGSGANSVLVTGTAASTPIFVNEGAGNDSNTVGNPATHSVLGIASLLTIHGNGGANTLTVDDAGSTSPAIVHVIHSQVGAAAGDNLFGAGGSLNYAGISSLTLNSPNASTGDTIFCAASTTTAFTINAGSPAPPTSPGDQLTIAGNGGANPTFTPNGTGAGKYTFTDRQPITYTGVEQLVFDNVPPTVTNAVFRYDYLPLAILLTFNKNVASSLPVSLAAYNLTTLSTAPIFVANPFDPVNDIATYTSAGPISDGNYRVTLSAGSITDAAGNTLAADFTFDFFVLAGDANHDGHVDETDQAILNAHLGQVGSATVSQGDFNYDNSINAVDTAILNANWHVWLPPQGDLMVQFPAGTVSYRLAAESNSMLDLFTTADPTPTYRIPAGALSSVSFLTAPGSGLNPTDTLTLDFSSGLRGMLGQLPTPGVTVLGRLNTLAIIGTPNNETLTVGPFGLSFDGTFSSTPIYTTNVQTLQFHGGSGGNDSINLTGGTYTIDADTPTGTPNVSVTVGPTAIANFATDQHLANLTVNGGTANLSTVRHSMVVNGLAISNNGLLDIANSFLYLNSTATSFVTVKSYLDAAYNLFGASNPNKPLAGDYAGLSGITSSVAKASYANDLVVGIGYYDGALQNPTNPDSVGQIYGPDSNSGHGTGIPLNQILIRPTLTGDFNGDGVVNSYDVSLFNSYGLFNNGPTPLGWQVGDLNGDSLVNVKDVTVFNSVGNFNQPPFPVPAVTTAVAKVLAQSVAGTGTVAAAVSVSPKSHQVRHHSVRKAGHGKVAARIARVIGALRRV